jgi:hypothetical protein
MTQHQKMDQNTSRIIHWLIEHSAEFEQGKIEEMLLADSVGLAKDEAMRAIDYLENREAIVRFPHPLSTPPQTMIKPGRGWQDLLEKDAGKAAGN